MTKKGYELGPSASLPVRRGRVQSVDLYEIKDSELEIFERGSPTDLQLNFAVALLSIAASGIFSISTATFANQTLKTALICTVVVGVLLGFYLLIAWFRNRTSMKALCDEIRQRMPAPTGSLSSSSEHPSDDTESPDPKG